MWHIETGGFERECSGYDEEWVQPFQPANEWGHAQIVCELRVAALILPTATGLACPKIVNLVHGRTGHVGFAVCTGTI